MATKPSAPTAPAVPVAWYALSQLHHDNVVYAPGDMVPIDDERGSELLALGVLTRVAPKLDAVTDEAQA